MAKALGCGVPVGAFAAVDKAARAMLPGDHGTTYGGNPLACAAISKVFEIFEEKRLLDHVDQIAPYLKEQLVELQKRHSCIAEIRGKGLMQGMELTVPAARIVARAMENGLVLISAGEKVIRIVPPLIVEKEHIDEMCQILDKILE